MNWAHVHIALLMGFAILLLTLSTATAGLMAKTANLREQVRHTEIRGEFKSLIPTGGKN